jgi:hypothetical protein
LPPCKHESLEFVGDQRTDDGVNSYYRCTGCGAVLVVLPSKKVIGIQGAQQLPPYSEGGNTS